MSTILTTPRLLLRTWTSADAEDAYGFWGDPEVMRYAGGPCRDVAAALRSLSIGIEVHEKHGVCLWPVVLRGTGAVVGCCGFHLEAEEGLVLELGYHFSRRFWGQGYATEAASACVDYAFDTLGATRILAWTHPLNPASSRVLDKIGFIAQGMDEGERAYALAPADRQAGATR